jgi:hypothetical protein
MAAAGGVVGTLHVHLPPTHIRHAQRSRHLTGTDRRAKRPRGVLVVGKQQDWQPPQVVVTHWHRDHRSGQQLLASQDRVHAASINHEHNTRGAVELWRHSLRGRSWSEPPRSHAWMGWVPVLPGITTTRSTTSSVGGTGASGSGWDEWAPTSGSGCSAIMAVLLPDPRGPMTCPCSNQQRVRGTTGTHTTAERCMFKRPSPRPQATAQHLEVQGAGHTWTHQ